MSKVASRTAHVNEIKKLKIAIIASVIIMTAVLVLGFLHLKNEISEVKKNDQITQNLSSYNHEKLLFCYENSIRPCSDDTIRTWNEAHPENKFKLKSFKDLVEEGIRQSKS